MSDPFQKLFSKFQSVNNHGISECGLLALYIRNACKLFCESDQKNGYANLKNSGKRSRAILALLLAHLSTSCSRGAFRVVRCPAIVSF